MVRVSEFHLSCDICNEEDARSWQITDPGDDKFYIDLCPRHGRDLEFLLNHAKPAKKGPFGTEALRATKQSRRP